MAIEEIMNVKYGLLTGFVIVWMQYQQADKGSNNSSGGKLEEEWLLVDSKKQVSETEKKAAFETKSQPDSRQQTSQKRSCHSKQQKLDARSLLTFTETTCAPLSDSNDTTEMSSANEKTGSVLKHTEVHKKGPFRHF